MQRCQSETSNECDVSRKNKIKKLFSNITIRSSTEVSAIDVYVHWIRVISMLTTFEYEYSRYIGIKGSLLVCFKTVFYLQHQESNRERLS